MKVARFFIFLSGDFRRLHWSSMCLPRRARKQIQFTGIIMGNDYIASPLVQGRLERLLVRRRVGSEKGRP